MKVTSYYHQNSDIKKFTYDEDEINRIINTLSSKLSFEDLINEYNLTTDGDRSLADVFKVRLFSILENELNFTFKKNSQGKIEKTNIISNFKNHRLTYDCKKNNYYLTYSTDNRGFLENKLFKNLLIVDSDPNAVNIILTVGNSLRDAGAWNSVILTHELFLDYLGAYKNHIDFPLVLIGIFVDEL